MLEDAWTWLHVKWMASRAEDSAASGRWQSSRLHKRCTRRHRRGPTLSQSRGERLNALEAVSLRMHNRFSPLQVDAESSVDSDSITTQCSGEEEGSMPLLTARSADLG